MNFLPELLGPPIVLEVVPFLLFFVLFFDFFYFSSLLCLYGWKKVMNSNCPTYEGGMVV